MVQEVALYKKSLNLVDTLTFILFKLAKTPAVGVLDGVDNVIWLCKVNLVLISNYLALGLSFK